MQIENILNTIMLQAELIKDMTYKLGICEGASTLRRRITGSSLNKISEVLQRDLAQWSSAMDLNVSINEINDAIQTARSGEEVFETVFGFAMRIAPLIFV